MATQVLAVVNQKGGVGKTTVCKTLGKMLQERGYQVLLIDLDAQQTLTFSLMKINPFEEELPSMYHVLMEGLPAEDAILRGEDYHIIRSDYRLYRYQESPLVTREEFARLRNSPKELYALMDKNYAENDDRYKLRHALSPLIKKNLYDFIIIDTNPSLNGILSMVLMAHSTCNVLVPAFAEESSRQSIVALDDTINTIMRNTLSQRIRIVGILVSRYEKNNISKKYLHHFERLATRMNTVLFNPIPKSVAIAESMAFRNYIFDHKNRSAIIREYEKFCDSFLDRMKELEE